jgi:hypothetical protein
MMGKSKLGQYAWESKLMEIFVKYGEEEYSFNLNEELQVNENRINQEIKDQPSAHAFIGMLHKKLIRIQADKKKEMEKIYAVMFIKFKKLTDDGTGRPTANDLAKEKAIASERYQTSIEVFHQAKEEAESIEVCVRGFEERKDLIQTLSANIRKTN